MAEIAVRLADALAERKVAGTAGQTLPRIMARSDDWTVADVVCTCGPKDAITVAARAVRLASGAPPSRHGLPLNAEARIARVIRLMDLRSDARPTLGALAREAGLSPYHFLRTFRLVAGVTPHQYPLRARLREAGLRLATTDAKVLDVAFDSGFGDVSNFNRAFRAEFGVSPRAYRTRSGA